MSDASITAVIPVYDGMPYLREALASLQAQTYERLRILAVDDGSTDGGPAFLRSVEVADPRLEVIANEHNLGLAETLNRAYAHARTPLVARLDQDDVAEPDRLARQVAWLDAHPDCLGVLSQVARIGAQGRRFGAYRTGREGEVRPYDPAVHGSLLHSTSCFRREAVLAAGGYRRAVYPVDDYDLLHRLWERGPLAVIEEPLVRYRIHGGASTFSTFSRMQRMTRYVQAMSVRRRAGLDEVPVERFEACDAAVPPLRRLARAIAEYGMLRFRLAGMYIGQGRTPRGIASLLLALLANPRFALGRLSRLRLGSV